MKRSWKIGVALFLIVGLATIVYAAGGGYGAKVDFPPELSSYGDAKMKNVGDILSNRIQKNPFNLVGSLIFLLAILHTFMASKLLALSHKWHQEHERKIKEGKADKNSVHLGAELFHFLGEVEVVFGIWAVVLGFAIVVSHGWGTFIGYIASRNFTEAAFVVVIMTLASTRPILKLAEIFMEKIANLLGGTLIAWWLTILTVGPILGSFITEPAAMTIAALLLANKLYELKPSNQLKYGTIGLLFVNISVGGTLSHFAAPPVLMVVIPWNWDFGFMLANFGWKAVLGIIIANGVYLAVFKKEMGELQKKYAALELQKKVKAQYIQREKLEDEFSKIKNILGEELGFSKTFDKKCEEIKSDLRRKTLEIGKDKDVEESHLENAFDETFEEIKLQEMRKTMPSLLAVRDRAPYHDPDWDHREADVPVWVMLAHVGFIIWTVIALNSHSTALFVGGFLFFLGFAKVTAPYQNRTDLKPALLVGFFLAGLVIHGGVQGWWIAPILSSLEEVPLMIGSTVLTAFNDNAAITLLSTLVPKFSVSEGLQYAVVAGAVTGGGLTVIANAPNPAGQAILSKYFQGGVSPLGLVKAALLPTVIMGLCFMLLKPSYETTVPTSDSSRLIHEKPDQETIEILENSEKVFLPTFITDRKEELIKKEVVPTTLQEISGFLAPKPFG